jgi:hypothetical protein
VIISLAKHDIYNSEKETQKYKKPIRKVYSLGKTSCEISVCNKSETEINDNVNIKRDDS